MVDDGNGMIPVSQVHQEWNGTCTPCNNMYDEASVDTCQLCSNATVEGCAAANCTAGYFGYTWAAHSCEPCRPISNATAGATYLCTNADDSRLCPAEVAAGSPACADRDGCIEGHFRSPALSVLASDVCAPCSGMADVASLINCTECINATSAGCLTGNCAPGYHTVK